MKYVKALGISFFWMLVSICGIIITFVALDAVKVFYEMMFSFEKHSLIPVWLAIGTYAIFAVGGGTIFIVYKIEQIQKKTGV